MSFSLPKKTDFHPKIGLMKKKQFIQDLIQDAACQAKEKEYIITEVAKVELNEMIRSGVCSMTIKDLSSVDMRQIVKGNLQYFIQAMTIDSKQRFMSKHLEYRSYVNARFEIKSLWPFY